MHIYIAWLIHVMCPDYNPTDVSSPPTQTISDTNGSYTFSAVMPGTYLVSAALTKAAFRKVCLDEDHPCLQFDI